MATLGVIGIICTSSQPTKISIFNAMNGRFLSSSFQGVYLTNVYSQEVYSVKRYLQDREQFHGISEADDIFPDLSFKYR